MPCSSMRQQATACSCVSSAGSTSTGFTLLGGVGAVALGQGGDQSVDALGIDLLRELAA
jgi:hypothetical protein